MRPIRIYVAAANEFAWGACEELWLRATPILLAAGVDVIASVNEWVPESPKVASLERLGCTLIRRPITDDELFRPIFELPFYERGAQTIAASMPDLVIVNQGDNREGLGWMEECLRLGVPYVVISHSVSDQVWPADTLATRLQKAFLGARQALFVSAHNRRLTEYQVMTPLPNAKIVPITFKVDYDTPPPEWRLEGRTDVAVVARLDPDSKGQDLLFEVLKTPLWQRRRIEVDLYGSGKCEGLLRSLRNRLGLVNVHFRGHVADIQAIWMDHHLLVLPSRVEGLPTAVIEAMLCGRVVVATDVGGTTELLQDGVTGFIAESPNVRHLSAALDRAWDRRDEWPAIGLTARTAIRKMVQPEPEARFARWLLELSMDYPRGQESWKHV